MLSQSIGQVREVLGDVLSHKEEFVDEDELTILLKWMEGWEHNARQMEALIESTTGKPVSMAMAQARSERIWKNKKEHSPSVKLHLAVDNTKPQAAVNV